MIHIQVFADDDVHAHSQAAYNIIKRYKIGNLSGFKKQQDVLNGSGGQASSKSQKKVGIDFNKPIIFQVWVLSNC
jgi:hypothetical protein